MAASDADERVFSFADHVVKKSKFKQVLSKRHTLFYQCSEKEALKFDQKVSHVYFTVFLRAPTGFDMNH